MFWLSYKCFSILCNAFLLKSAISSHNSCECNKSTKRTDNRHQQPIKRKENNKLAELQERKIDRANIIQQLYFSAFPLVKVKYESAEIFIISNKIWLVSK